MAMEDTPYYNLTQPKRIDFDDEPNIQFERRKPITDVARELYTHQINTFEYGFKHIWKTFRQLMWLKMVVPS